jgi:hypothetical protein
MKIQIIFIYNFLMTLQNLKYRAKLRTSLYLSQMDLLILVPFNQVFKFLINEPDFYFDLSNKTTCFSVR